MTIRCIAVDDEPLALEKLKSFIIRVPSLRLEASFREPMKAIEFLGNCQAELLFLDIQMAEMTGFDLLGELTYKPQVIFTTAYDEFALKAFDLSVTDYLLKPYTFERFMQAVARATEFAGWQQMADMARQKTDYIFVKSGYRLVKVMLSEILYMEGMRDFISVFTVSERILASHTFAEMEKILPPAFVRCHKSYIVSLPRIDSIEKDRIRIGEKYIPVGDAYRESFYERLK